MARKKATKNSLHEEGQTSEPNVPKAFDEDLLTILNREQSKDVEKIIDDISKNFYSTFRACDYNDDFTRVRLNR